LLKFNDVSLQILPFHCTQLFYLYFPLQLSSGFTTCTFLTHGVHTYSHIAKKTIRKRHPRNRQHCRRRNCQEDNSKTSSKKQTTLPQKKKTRRLSKKSKPMDSSSDDDEDETFCLVRVEPYSNSRPKEVWVQCTSCKMWAHELCTSRDSLANMFYVCENCDSDSDVEPDEC